MPIINKISNKLGINGDIVIKFNIKTTNFQAIFPEKMNCDNSLLYSKSYDELLINIDLIIEQHFSEILFVKKWIVIKFKSSESKSNENKVEFSSDERIYTGMGFLLEWFVVNEYKIASKYLPERYKIVEKSKNTNINIDIQPNVFGQLFMGDKVRKIEYTNELYIFLQSLEVSISNLCQSLMDFFDEDTEIFLKNVQTNGQTLLK